MKITFVLVALLTIVSTQSCKSKKDAQTSNPVVETGDTLPVKDSIPACIRLMIADNGKENAGSKPVQVDEYNYNGKIVYLTIAPCCDQYNKLYDDSCRVICAPSGGIAGSGDRKCPDFSKTATHTRMLWKAPEK